MTAPTVTTPLQDASGTWLVHPYWGLADIPVIDANGDEIFVSTKCIGGETFNRTTMERITVDGVEYINPGGTHYWSSYLFSTRTDPSCDLDFDGNCACRTGYRPVSYAQGEICERCWLEAKGEPRGENIRGIGTAGCPHN